MSTVRARVDHRLSTPPGQVFDAWLDPDRLRAWMPRALQAAGLPGDLRRVEVDARVGGRFTFSDLRPSGEAVHWGVYRGIDRPRRLVFTWWTSPEEEAADASTVTLTLEPEGDGTRATMVHEMSAQWAEHVERVEAAWSGMLSAIDEMPASDRSA